MVNTTSVQNVSQTDMRLFIGIDLPSELKQELHQYLLPLQKSLKGWEDPHDYHQTLLFIGEATEEDCELIIGRLKDFKYRPFTLKPDKIQFFPRRVMFLSFEHSPELLELKNKVEELFPEWVRPHSKPFIPHVTVKRFQRYEHADLVRGLANNAFQNNGFPVQELCLFKSEKDSLNRKYHVIFKSVL